MGYKISDISKKTGLSAYTLRFYDQKGLLPFHSFLLNMEGVILRMRI